MREKEQSRGEIENNHEAKETEREDRLERKGQEIKRGTRKGRKEKRQSGKDKCEKEKNEKLKMEDRRSK